jgi:peptidoglycan/LPS O-acetylase OafA/YrhL
MARNLRIDRLRGLAILIAVTSHTQGYMTWDFQPFTSAIPPLMTNGCFGVSIFFVVSGYLITQRLLGMQHLPAVDLLRDFYIQRAGRLLPCLALAVLLAAVLSAYGPPAFAFKDGAYGHFLYCLATLQYNHCILEGSLPGVLNPLWSLSVEEVFYLFWPLVIAAGVLLPTGRSLLLISLVAFGPYFRSKLGAPDVYTFFGNFDQLAMGCLAAIHADRIKRGFTDLRWAGLALIGLTFFGTILTQSWTWPPTFVGIGATLYLLGSSSGDARQTLLFRPLEEAGKLSYEMYLFHFPILGVLVRPTYDALHLTAFFGPRISWVCLAVLIAALFAVSLLISRYFSDPLNKFIRGLHVKRASRPVAFLNPDTA